MRLRFRFVSLTLLSASMQFGNLRAQGEIAFVNRIGTTVDAPVTYPDGTPVGPEFSAQLLAGPRGASLASLKPQLPISPFRDQPPESRGYFVPQNVTLDGIAVDQPITVFVRAYNGGSWENATWRGQSEPLNIDTDTIAPPNLIGLKPFNVYPVPEPCVIVLLASGAAAMACANQNAIKRENNEKVCPSPFRFTRE